MSESGHGLKCSGRAWHLRFPSKNCRDRDDLYSELSRALSRAHQGNPQQAAPPTLTGAAGRACEDLSAPEGMSPMSHQREWDIPFPRFPRPRVPGHEFPSDTIK